MQKVDNKRVKQLAKQLLELELGREHRALTIEAARMRSEAFRELFELIEPARSPYTNRRSFPRITGDFRIDVKVGEMRHYCSGRNLSVTGACVELPETLPVHRGKLGLGTLTCFGADYPLDMEADVAWFGELGSIGRGMRQVGLSFSLAHERWHTQTELSRAFRSLYLGYLEALAENGSQIRDNGMS